MKLTLLFAASILVRGTNGQTNLNSCSKQANCLSFSMTKQTKSACDIAGFGKVACEWKVCMTYNNCKDGPISHICGKDPNACHTPNNKLDGLATTAYLVQEWPANTPECQIVKPGKYAGFHVKDGSNKNGCSPLSGTSVTVDVDDCPIQAVCNGIDINDLSTQCAGNGQGQKATCNWGFKTPLCGTDKCGGDPHFARWGHLGIENHRFPFHGQCDLVVMHTPQFENGLGLDLHVRTTIHKFFSFIEHAALRIGGNTFEVHSGGVDRDPYQLFLNGNPIDEGDLPIAKEGFKIARIIDSDKWDTFEVTLPVGDVIRFHVLSMYITIETHGSTLSFDGTVGIKGDFNTGELLARDGVTNMSNNTDAFGQEWQVRDSDPQLFRETRAPQWPQQCVMPKADKVESRRLAYSRHDTEFMQKAEEACSTVSAASDHEFCMFDVLSTGDLVMAEMFDHRKSAP